MKTTMRIAVIAMMGMSLGVSAQWVSNGDSSTTGGIIINSGASGSYFKRKFDYNGGGWARTLIEYENSLMSSSNFTIASYGGTTDHIYSYLGYGNYNDTKNLRLYPNGNTYFGGNVGIGITTPKAKLDVFSETDEVALRLSMPTNKNAAAYEIKWANENINVVHRVQYSNVYYDFMDVNRSNRNVTFNGGNVGIGTADTKGFKLGVNGKIAATEVKVATYANWSDFVFYDDYQLPTLTEVENHIKEKGHLKDIPSAKEVEKNGFFLGAMDAKLLQKIEELTLYTIEQEKKIKLLEKQQTKLEEQEKKIERLEVLVKKLLKE
ncbi:hypothetical protein [Tenacibaculum discolor]|uniref:hypothetical protein n=1 Tax=Tenacibaculum discolor TaxID=361581 RepID=UPI003F78E287